MSTKDDGNMFKNGAGLNALDHIGRLSPYNWLWSPSGFYDDSYPKNGWADWPYQELVPYTEMKKRI
jgi:hypothetical protein